MKKVLSVYIVFVLFMIQGCASDFHYARDLTSSSMMENDEGIIILSVSHNHNIPPFLNLYIHNVENNQEYIIYNHAIGFSQDTGLYIGMVPKGRYILSQLSNPLGLYLSLINYQDKDFKDKDKFIIKSGRATDLGRLIISKRNKKILIGNSKLHPDNRVILQKYFPEYSALVDNKIIQGWEGGIHRDKGVIEAFAITHPIGKNDVIELSSGHLVAGSSMGSILLRYPDTSWKLFSHTGDLNPVLALSPYEKGENLFVAGGEFGTFVRVNRKGKAAKIDAGNLPSGHIVFIHHNNNFTKWYVGVETNKTIDGKVNSNRTIFQSEKLEGGLWKELATYNCQGHCSYQQEVFEVSIFKHPDGIGVLTKNDNSLSCYDMAREEWVSNVLPQPKSDLSYTAFSTNGAVGIVKGKQIYSDSFYSLNCGKTWTEVFSPVLKKRSAPYLLPDGNIIQSTLTFNGSLELYGSMKMGEKGSWDKLADDLSGQPLIASARQGLFWLYYDRDGIESILRSSNDGKSWSVEHSAKIKEN